MLFDYRYLSHSGGDTKDESSAWSFDGFAWNPAQFVIKDIGNEGNITYQAANLGFGMTYTPIENLIIGAGLNSFLDQFFTVDLASMKVDAGTFWTTGNNIAAYFGKMFGAIHLDLTVSYKF